MATTTQLEPAQVAESTELHDLRGSPRESRRTSANHPRGPQDAPADERLDRQMILKLVAAGFSFFVSGINDGSIGPLIPYIIREYNLTTAVVSIV